MWHPDAVPVVIKSKLGLPLIGTPHRAPVRKVLLHTTEGGSISSAVSAYRARRGLFHGIHPHFTFDPANFRLAQHVPTDRASYAIKKYDREGIIQIELVGYANTTPGWIPRKLDNIAALLRWIFDNHPGINRRAHATFLGSGLLAAPYPRGRARMSPEEFLSFSGVVGHQHAPADDHWDPGALDVATILSKATDPIDLLPEEEMIVYDPNADRVYTVSNGTIRVSDAKVGMATAVYPDFAYIAGDLVAAGTHVVASPGVGGKLT